MQVILFPPGNMSYTVQIWNMSVVLDLDRQNDDNGNAMLTRKRIFKGTRHKISVPLAMNTNL